MKAIYLVINWRRPSNGVALKQGVDRTVDGSKGGGGRQGQAPLGSKLFHFHAVFGKTFAK